MDVIKQDRGHRVCYCFFAVSLFLVFSLLLAGTVLPAKIPAVLPAGTPYVSQNGEVRGVTSSIIRLPSNATRVVYSDIQNCTTYRLNAVKYPGCNFIFLPGSRLTEKGMIIGASANRSFFACAVIAALFSLLAGTVLYEKLMDKNSSMAKMCLCMFCIFMIHYFFLAIFRWQEPNVFITEADSHGYFGVIKRLWDGDFHTPGMYTVGLPLIYWPFMLIFNAENVSTITPYLAAVSSLIIMPCSFCIVQLTAWKVIKSIMVPFLGIVFWLIITNFFLIVENPVAGGMLSPLGIFHEIDGMGYIYYVYRLALTGFSQISEPWAFFFSAMSVMAVVYVKQPTLRALICGILFGFSCLIRINLIFFSPLLFYLFFLQDENFLRKAKHTFFIILFAGLSFLTVFSIQFFLNYCYFQDCLCFPYCLHSPLLYKGFTWSIIPQASKFYFTCFGPLLGLCIAGLITCSDTKVKTFVVLASFPMLFFFCGMNAFWQNYRFLTPVYPYFAIGCMTSSIWRENKIQFAVGFTVLLFLLTIPEWPVRLFLDPALSNGSIRDILVIARSWYFLPLSLGAVLFFIYRKMMKVIVFFLIYLWSIFCLFPCGTLIFFFLFLLLCIVYVCRGQHCKKPNLSIEVSQKSEI